ncbi:MAG: transcriptional activator NhaR [Deltaproteobacteria bacterium]|nr:transcriptional activator NhaR [Deltaproteobacteria bacterium]
MDWLNYHHLLYFWMVAREGGLAPAAAKLRLTHPTLHAQIRALEESLGEKLFAKQGRKLALTEVGRMVYGYADEIFLLGGELLDAVKGRPTGRPARLAVGLADVVPKLVARRLLEPALQLDQPVRLIVTEDSTERLLAQLSLHELDVVISDAPVGAGTAVRAFSHLLGECGVTFFAARALAAKVRPGFPRSIEGQPILLPTEGTGLRRSLDHWFDKQGLRPVIAAEIEDSALLKILGQKGLGVFAAPDAIEDEVRRQYEVEVVGRSEELRERFYALSVERRLKHPAVVAILEGARREVFAAEDGS